ncbi:MAG: hypothetical protein HN919_08500 [Verrucomicrobia bacterium]|jgi:CheY-like chemotaxis protein|nr:hypothetical protein [Verrucomicrobiota bacterium]MBT7066326.1 hypothetical protein [Verrucomicrobiota bacterium]MBT7700218.1 hypothetical protein [Verrucomicrobiota bacterium]
MNNHSDYLPLGPRPRTVLVVDGDPTWRASTCRVIGSEYPVLAATCGAEALQTARSVKPDLIVVDIMEPAELEGDRIVDALWKDPATRSIRVIVVSDSNVAAERLMDWVRSAIGPSPSDKPGMGGVTSVHTSRLGHWSRWLHRHETMADGVSCPVTEERMAS